VYHVTYVQRTGVVVEQNGDEGKKPLREEQSKVSKFISTQCLRYIRNT